MRIGCVVGVLCGALLWSISPAASAARYDIILGRLCTKDGNNQTICSQDKFERLMTDLGLIIAPVFLAPAETLGINGFELALEGTVAPLYNRRDYWVGKLYPTDTNTVSVSEGKPQSSVVIPRLHLRKGLPFSFEIGTQVAYVPDSSLFTVGAEIKWAFQEGFRYIPDFALRFSINHMVGSRDFELTTGGWDISISKAFGLGGSLSLTPYIGYNMLFIDATAQAVLVLADPNIAAEHDENFNFKRMRWQDNIHNRFFVGCRLVTYIFQFAAEGVFSTEVSLFNFKVGFDY